MVDLPNPRKSHGKKKKERKADVKGKGGEGSVAEAGKVEEENSKNIQEAFVAEGEISEKVLLLKVTKREKKTKNDQKDFVAESQIYEMVP